MRFSKKPQNDYAQFSLLLEEQEPLHDLLITQYDDRFDDAIEEFENTSIFGWDLESYRIRHAHTPKKLDAVCPWRNKIRLIQVGLPSMKGLAIDLGVGRDSKLEEPRVKRFMEVLKKKLYCLKTIVVGHNLYFDVASIYYHFGFKVRTVRDTQVLSKMIYGGTTFRIKHSLGACCKRELGFSYNKSYGGQFDWMLPLNNNELNYGYYDSTVVLDLYEHQKEIIIKQGWVRAAQSECDVVPIFAQMSIDGYPMREDLLVEATIQREKVLDAFVEKFASMYPEELSFSSPTEKLLKHIMGGFGLDVPYDYIEHMSLEQKKRPDIKFYLDAFLKDPRVEVIFDCRAVKKQLDYLRGLSKALWDGRVHTKYNTLASECNGRTSSSSWLKQTPETGLNIQNPPKDIKSKNAPKVCQDLFGKDFIDIRSLFGVDTSKEKMVILDLPQAHYAIATESGDDKVAKDMFKNGIDQHSLVGATVAKGQGYEKQFWDWAYIQETQNIDGHADQKSAKKLRKLGKVGNYSQLNGSGAATMNKSNKLGIDVNKDIIKSWADTFQGISNLMKNLVREANSFNVRFPQIPGRVYGLTYGKDGRPMHLEKTPNRFHPERLEVYPSKTYCHHWLACEKTIMARTMIRIYTLFEKHPEWEASIVNMIHDELNIVGKKEFIDRIAESCDAIMHQEFSYYVRDTQVPWDCWKKAIAESWADK